jgi:hypothetical protein
MQQTKSELRGLQASAEKRPRINAGKLHPLITNELRKIDIFDETLDQHSLPERLADSYLADKPTLRWHPAQMHRQGVAPGTHWLEKTGTSIDFNSTRGEGQLNRAL